MSLEDSTYIIIDCETTGIYPEKGARVCEIGALKIEKGKVTETFQRLINPGISMPAEASAVNGIYDFELINAPFFKDIAEDFLQFIADKPLFGYKIGFDSSFLDNELIFIQKKPLNNLQYDVLVLARSFFSLPKYKLTEVAKYLNLDIKGSHRALKDCQLTFAVLQKMMPDIESRALNDMKILYNFCGFDKNKQYKKDDVKHNFIHETIENGQKLKIVYTSATGEETQREIEPQRIEKRGKDYYLVARCLLRSDKRSFDMKRIKEYARI